MSTAPADRCRVPQAFWHVVARIGVPPAALLRQARLPATLHLGGPGQVNTAQFFALWKALEQLAPGPGLGISLVQAADTAVHPPSSLAAFLRPRLSRRPRPHGAFQASLHARGAAHCRERAGVSSVAGLVASPITGFYHASKWAFEALHESLAQEVRAFGVKVTLLEPGAYATEFASQTSLKLAAGIDAYADLKRQVFASSANIDFGDPRATTDAIFGVVDAADPPLRLFLGTEGLPAVRAAYANRLATWEAWASVSNAAQGASSGQTITL